MTHERTKIALLAALMSVCVFVCSAGLAAGAKADPLEAAKVALRGRHYDDAAGFCDKVLADKPDEADEALYLKALALYYAGKYDEAIKAADELVAKHKQSAWLRKARFLKARALIEQRKFKPAEAIYEAEANRLLSEARKQEIAGVIIKFADALATKPAPDDLAAPPPNYAKAYNLYRKALAMEIGRDLRDKVMFKRARTIQLAGNPGQAVNDYRAYVAEFDPDWTGNVGTITRLSGQKREKPKPAGKHILQSRYRLAEAQLLAGDYRSSRVNLEDLLALIAEKTADKKPGPEIRGLIADSRWQLVRTYRLPNAGSSEMERGIKSARDFCVSHTDDPRAVVAAWWVAQAYHSHGRADQAIAAYEDFVAAKHYKLPAGNAAAKKLDDLKKSPAELQDEWRKVALFQIAQIRFGQKKYAEAKTAWQGYIKKYPNGPHWSTCQRGIINAEFQVAVDAVTDKKYDEARKLFKAFLAKNPLDARARQILFTIGQIDYAAAQKLGKDKGDKADKEKIKTAYRRAVDHWQRLVSKYPGTQESSLALYRVGVIYEEQLGELEKALESYRRLTWGSYASQARARVAVMTAKHLEVRTERKYRTNETPQVHLTVRNVEKLTFKQYFLDLEAYFRKTHAIGRVDRLDIDLIQPDKTWEVKIDKYAKYKPIRQEVEIPYAQSRPGVCIVNVSEDDLEATTLVIRSDLDMIIKSSRRQVLVFVQDMVKNTPAGGVELLLSDGKKVFATGKTGKDGVFKGGFSELKDVKTARVFALADGNVASNLLNLSGLGFSTGLSPKGYIYTDRPAYQPGQTVAVRGIIRDVKDGSYLAPKDETYLVSVTDASGRLLWHEPQTLSQFGTFHTKMQLDARAPLGRYTITARHKTKAGKAYSSTFLVQRFKLEKMRLRLKTDRGVYFRGETVELTVRAEYYWGQPVADKPIRYYLPDGRQFVQKADAGGKLIVKYDTSGQTPGRALTFSASIEGENVRTSHRVTLALQGFAIAVKPSGALALAGEPFDVEIKTTTPDGKPAGKEITLLVLRRQTPKVDPVLSAVPWIGAVRQPSVEVTVEEKKVTTDAKTGKATVNLKLEKGGRYILRATGEDRFKQVVTAQSSVQISDDEDATKLRFFAATDTLKVGGQAEVRLHSRLDADLALLTYEGEEIISYRVMKIAKGYNPLAVKVGHEHFPNFRVAVSVIDPKLPGLRSAAKPFTVQRQLNVTVKPLKDVYAPGAAGKAELIVTDQLGKPVIGELSLALIDEALFAVFPDKTPKIGEFFERGARRHAEFRAVSTCPFSYTAVTHKVVKAYQDEKGRLARAKEEVKKLRELQVKLPRPVFRGTPARPIIAADLKHIASGKTRIVSGRELRSRLSSRGGAVAGLRIRPPAKPGEPATADGPPTGPSPDDGRSPQPRREMPEAGLWIGSIVTDKGGKAIVDLPMPETTAQWRLTARGCTVETLVGQAKSSVITRKDFFIALKAPQMLQEGDTVRVLARIHNLTDFAGEVALKLEFFGGDDLTARLAERTTKADVKKQGAAEALFDGVEIPLAAALKIRVTATAGKHADALETVLDVRPWGLEFADHAGGVARNDVAVEVELPKRKYGSQWMLVSVGPDLNRSVIEMGLGRRVQPVRAAARCRMPIPPRGGGFAGSDLLATVSALKYAKAVGAQRGAHERLTGRARSLVSALVVSQRKDGGWSWARAAGATDWAVAAMSFWALCEARNAGLVVHSSTIAKAQTYLKSTFTRLGASDNDAKAVILHALSVNGAAEFAHANRLHRERNRLSAPALAYTALAFVNLKRNEFAGEILDALERLGKASTLGARKLISWPPSTRHPWMNDPVETTALAVLALMRVRPDSPKIKQAVDYLMDRRGAYGFSPTKSAGPAVAAVAEYFRAGKFAAADYKLNVLVNGKKFKTLASKGAPSAVELHVPRGMIKDGKNLIEFRMDGRGEFAYAVTIRGFSSDLKDPNSWRYPYVRGRYYRHDTLRYRGRPIGASSTSPVKDIEIGQRVKVHVSVYNSSSHKTYMIVEEHLPAGMMLVSGSLSGRFIHKEIDAGKIVMYFPAGHYVGDFSYELVGYATGSYRALPTVIRDTLHPGRMRVGAKADLRVLKPGEKSDDQYVMNYSERYALGCLYFKDGLYKRALEKLSYLFKKHRSYNEREVARMLLWIYTSKGFYDAKQIVGVFEVLRERYPTLEIPFDKILVVGRAYRDIGEFERAYLVFKATIDASFINDANVSAVLEDEGQFLGSIDYQEDLWREYPDTAQVTTAYFALSQALYQKAPKAHELAKQARQIAAARRQQEKPAKPKRKPDKIEMLKETIRLLTEFLTLYPTSPLADDAAFSMANAFLDLKQYSAVVELCDGYKRHFAASDFVSGFQYMMALGHFWQRRHDDALAAAKVVADGSSKDRDFATYIVAQIYHSQGSPADAITWYGKIATKYADAKQAIDYFKAKHIALEEVNIFRPGKPVELKIDYRNIKTAFCQVYSVDLMKLYLREKNLANITKINLAGIKPLVEQTIPLGDGKDYVDKKKTTTLKLEKEGAYLVICRGDDLFTSALVLITPLKIEVQEDAASGRVRANVINDVKKQYVPEVHVKATGSGDPGQKFRSGQTDLRGIFVAENIRGKATVIARQGDARYAFYRGEKWLGAPKAQPKPKRPPRPTPAQPDYQMNLRMQNDAVQRGNIKMFDQMRRAKQSGVQIQKAK